MNQILQKLLQPTFLLTLAAALKLILQPYGIKIADSTVNLVVNIICGLGTVIGLWIDHGNKVKTAAPAFPPIDLPPSPEQQMAVYVHENSIQFPDKP